MELPKHWDPMEHPVGPVEPKELPERATLQVLYMDAIEQGVQAEKVRVWAAEAR